MENKLLLCFLFVLILAVQSSSAAPLFKVFCSGTPLFRGRVDSIVQPGIVSGHVHKVAGGSNFGPALASNTPLQIYNDMVKSPCTTCSINKVDLSAYWHPDLYYRWPNNTLSLVPKGGLTVYYLARSGSGSQANPRWTAFPPGFRMTSGNPFRRSYNASKIADQAISFACLSDPGGPETPYFPTATRFCKNGLRMQVHFPQCWNGIDLDTPNHQDHMAFPIQRPDGGDCPPTHPIRMPDLFFEAFYSVDKFPHGAAPDGDGTQRFVLACGDSTGYGMHGDFLNGWNQTILQKALDDPSCDHTNTNEGNNVAACVPLAPFLQSSDARDACTLNRKIPLTEQMAQNSLMNNLAGCNPITGGPAAATPCSAPPSATEKAPASVRFHLQSVLTGKYASCPFVSSDPFKANYVSPLTYAEIFVAKPYPGGYYNIQTEGSSLNFLSASGTNSALMCNRGSASDWEAFQIIAQANNNVAIISKKNGKYVSASADGTLTPDATTVGTAQLFKQVVPDGGNVY